MRLAVLLLAVLSISAGLSIGPPLSSVLGATFTFQGALQPAIVTTPVASDISGSAACTFDDASNQLTCSVITSITPRITAVHVHEGGSSANGTAVLQLQPRAGVRDVFFGEVFLTSSQSSLLFSGRMYVDVHTTVNPAGELRGQLVQAPGGAGASRVVPGTPPGAAPTLPPPPEFVTFPPGAVTAPTASFSPSGPSAVQPPSTGDAGLR